MPHAGMRAVAPHAPSPEIEEDAGERPAPASRSRSDRLVVAGLLALIGVPFVVAVAALRRPHWYPVLDLAMTELRLRDVGTRHTPLIGLPGRIGPSLAEQGSHPGPLSFYLLAPVYRLLGSSAWALQAATAVLNLAALGVALAIARRRGGSRLVLTVAALAALLVSGYGIAPLTEPWNPYLPLLWWVVLLLAVWSVAVDDLAMLPVAVFAGSFCAQTHVPYLGLALGLGAVVVGVVVLAWRRAPAGSDARRRLVRWGAAGLVLGVLLWTPPLVDQAVNDPGNMRRLYDHLATPEEDPVGLGRGVELALVHLNVVHFITGDSGANGSLVDASSDPEGSVLPGLAVLALWVGSAIAAVRIGHRALVRLHVVVAAGLVLGVVSMSRIFGKVWFYLMQWAWGVSALLVLAVGWTAYAVVAPRLSPTGRRRLAGGAVAALLGVTVVASAVTTARAVGIDPPAANLSSTLGDVLPPTIDALERGEGAATGRDGRYVVMWSDAFYFGSQGYGIVSELRRAGFHAGAAPPWHVPITDHRVIDPTEATAVVQLATGVFVDQWREVPGAREVAYVEPRSPEELAEFMELREEVIEELRADGLHDIVPVVDGNLFGASIDERVSKDAQRRMARMLELGEPTAIFIAPPGTTL